MSQDQDYRAIRELLANDSFQNRILSAKGGVYYTIDDFKELVPKNFLDLGGIRQGGVHAPYSVLEHTIRKLNFVCEALHMNEEGYTGKEIEYMLQASLWHDYGKIDPRSKTLRHEDVSAELAEPILDSMGYNPGEVSLITHLIRTEDTFGIVSYYLDKDFHDLALPSDKIRKVKEQFAPEYIGKLKNDALDIGLRRIIDYSATLCHADVFSIPGLKEKAPNILLVKSGFLEYMDKIGL